MKTQEELCSDLEKVFDKLEEGPGLYTDDLADLVMPLVAAAVDFIDRADTGRSHLRESYASFKNALEHLASPTFENDEDE